MLFTPVNCNRIRVRIFQCYLSKDLGHQKSKKLMFFNALQQGLPHLFSVTDLFKIISNLRTSKFLRLVMPNNFKKDFKIRSNFQCTRKSPHPFHKPWLLTTALYQCFITNVLRYSGFSQDDTRHSTE